MNSRDEQLHQIVGDVLDISAEDVTDQTSTDTAESWTSLNHLNLIMAIEEGFSITVSPEDAMDLLSVKIIRMYLDEQGIN